MDRDPQPDYTNWSQRDLQKAEATASRFLEDNSAKISETLQTKLKYLDAQIHRLSRRNTSFEDRLECFARISEVAGLLKQDADGFFDLAAQPVVARILRNVKR